MIKNIENYIVNQKNSEKYSFIEILLFLFCLIFWFSFLQWGSLLKYWLRTMLRNLMIETHLSSDSLSARTTQVNYL